jgi:hypothetical protein
MKERFDGHSFNDKNNTQPPFGVVVRAECGGKQEGSGRQLSVNERLVTDRQRKVRKEVCTKDYCSLRERHH